MKSAIAATVFAVLGFAVNADAQTDPEYKMEIGAGVGLMGYLGDFNGNLTKDLQPAWSLVGKYRFNPRMSLALNITSGKMKGSSKDVATWYPELNDTTIDFSNAVVDAGLRFEYNFWPFGTGREYRGAKMLTPFVAVGLGTTFANADDGNVFTMNVPIGLGVKYKVATRLNLALEWMMHFSLSDKLDSVEDPYGIESSGLFKNTDCYSTLCLSLTYDIWAKCRTCHNERE